MGAGRQPHLLWLAFFQSILRPTSGGQQPRAISGLWYFHSTNQNLSERPQISASELVAPADGVDNVNSVRLRRLFGDRYLYLWRIPPFCERETCAARNIVLALYP